MKNKADLSTKKMLFKSIKLTAFLLLMALAFIGAAMFVVTPLVLNTIIREHSAVAISTAFLVVGVLIFGHLIDAISIFFKNKLVQKYNVEATLIMYRKVFKLAYDKYIQMEPSSLQQRVYSAVVAYSGFYFGTMPSFIVNVVMIVTTLTITATVSPMVSLLMFLTLPLNYFGYKALNKKLGKLSVKLNDICSDAWKNENAIISQIDFIKQNHDNSYLLPMIGKHKNDAQDITRKVNNYANGMSSILSGANLIIRNLLTLLLASMMLQDMDFVGSALFIILVLPYFTSAVSQLTNTNLSVSAIRAADVFIDELTEASEPDGDKSLERIDNIRVDIDEVSIGDKVLIRDAAMNFKKGDIIGIIGGSGKGKSTLAKLIMKFRPSCGIYVNDVPIDEIRNCDYLRRVSYYSQETPIITDTILSNLSFGRRPMPGKDFEKLEFLKKFPDLNEIILENGANLSGGDKQRVSLARFFTEEADIVILDEPTSSLDGETESDILSAIFHEAADKIIFLISHRQENMRFCTHIAKVEDERLVVEEL